VRDTRSRVEAAWPRPSPSVVHADKQDFYDVPELAILRIMDATGLRLSEVVDLALGDVDVKPAHPARL
jgi:site-specific recombinase XerC